MRTALQDAGIDYDSAETSFLPSVQVPLDEDGARKVFRLIDALEDLDDVQNVYANFDVSDEILEAVGARVGRPLSAQCRPTKRSCAGAWRPPVLRVVPAGLDAAGRGGGDAAPADRG